MARTRVAAVDGLRQPPRWPLAVVAFVRVSLVVFACGFLWLGAETWVVPTGILLLGVTASATVANWLAGPSKGLTITSCLCALGAAAYLVAVNRVGLAIGRFEGQISGRPATGSVTDIPLDTWIAVTAVTALLGSALFELFAYRGSRVDGFAASAQSPEPVRGRPPQKFGKR